MLTIRRDCVPTGETQRALRAIGGRERHRAGRLVVAQRLLGNRRHQRDGVERVADQAGMIRWSGDHHPGAVHQHGRHAGLAAEIGHDLRQPVDVDAGDHDGILLRIDRRHRIGGHHHRPAVGPAAQIVAEHEATVVLRLLEIFAIAEIEPDLHVERRALHDAVPGDEHDAADPGQHRRQAGAQHLAALPNAAGGADIGRRFQHGLDRGDHLALGLGGVRGEVGIAGGGLRDLLAAGIFQGADAIEHQRRDQHHRKQGEPGTNTQNLLEPDPVAVESNARHSIPLPARKVECRASKSLSRIW
jgi:hypothetical protein